MRIALFLIPSPIVSVLPQREQAAPGRRPGPPRGSAGGGWSDFPLGSPPLGPRKNNKGSYFCASPYTAHEVSGRQKKREPPLPTTTPHPFLHKEHVKIRGLFDAIAPRYDLLNHLLSFNLDRYWRRQAIGQLAPQPVGHYLDACAGTGDLAMELSRQVRPRGVGSVLATDFSLPMLQGGIQKNAEPGVHFVAGDTLRLPFADRVFAGATVGFGIRNVENLAAALTELRRTLGQGGQLVLLEFTLLENRLLRPFLDLYCQVVLPRLGNWLSGSREKAYTYLQESIDRWPRGDELASQMREAGFKGVTWRPLFPGNVALHSGYR